MKKELIAELFQKFEHASYLLESVECWSARELQVIFNYTEWRNFLKVINKAKDSCLNSGESIPNHFVDVNKMVSIGSGADRPIDDIALNIATFPIFTIVYEIINLSVIMWEFYEISNSIYITQISYN
jgi:hypothetical protein